LILFNRAQAKITKDFKSVIVFFSLAPVVVELLAISRFFHQIKLSKHIWDPCGHLAAENGSLLILIVYFLKECYSIETGFPGN
jgi:hypothetical protein